MNSLGTILNILESLYFTTTEHLGDFLYLQIPAKGELLMSNLDITLQFIAVYTVSSGGYLATIFTFLKWWLAD